MKFRYLRCRPLFETGYVIDAMTSNSMPYIFDRHQQIYFLHFTKLLDVFMRVDAKPENIGHIVCLIYNL